MSHVKFFWDILSDLAWRRVVLHYRDHCYSKTLFTLCARLLRLNVIGLTLCFYCMQWDMLSWRFKTMGFLQTLCIFLHSRMPHQSVPANNRFAYIASKLSTSLIVPIQRWWSALDGGSPNLLRPILNNTLTRGTSWCVLKPLWTTPLRIRCLRNFVVQQRPAVYEVAIGWAVYLPKVFPGSRPLGRESIYLFMNPSSCKNVPFVM